MSHNNSIQYFIFIHLLSYLDNHIENTNTYANIIQLSQQQQQQQLANHNTQTIIIQNIYTHTQYHNINHQHTNQINTFKSLIHTLTKQQTILYKYT